MEKTELEQGVTALLRETAAAHHQAFLRSDGQDADWALWYAERLRGPLSQRLGCEVSRTDLVRTLAELDDEHRAREPGADWAVFYGRALVERLCSPRVRPDLAEETLALYHFPSCPFCVMVRAEIDRLGVDVELRDIRANAAFRDELVAARGRPTVPVLRCTGAEGDRWMPESRDIIRYLRERFG